MHRIYCISGLAADHRLFRNLSIHGHELVPLPWIAYTNDDDMSSYAAKIAQHITDEKAIIIGLSFGGMLATEIARAHPDWQVFIVSSAKTRAELGYEHDLLKWVSRKEIFPAGLFNIPYFSTLYLLGARTDEEKELLRQITKESDPVFNRWCVKTILNWDGSTYTQNITHIHGSNDKIIRPVNVRPNYWIRGGSHLMIYNCAAEISKIIADRLAHEL